MKGSENMSFIIFFLILLCFFIYGILNIVFCTKKLIQAVETTEEKTRKQRDDIDLLNEKLKETFIQFSSLKDMNEDAKYCFYEYIVNNIYISQYIYAEFIKEFDYSKASNINVTKLDKNSINKDNVLILINELLNSKEYRKKILINEDYYVAYSIVTCNGVDNSTDFEARYFKLKIVKESDFDLILENIREKGEFSLKLFIQNIDELEYNRYISKINKKNIY